jgi:DNA-binding HxlR family transcriptional regulator
LENKADKIDLEKKCNKLGDLITSLGKDISQVSGSLELLKSKEIVMIIERLSALEKRFTVLQDKVGGIKVPEF